MVRWPLRSACSHVMPFDHSVQVSGDPSKVRFTVVMGEVEIDVDWNVTTSNQYTEDQMRVRRGNPPQKKLLEQSIPINIDFTVFPRAMTDFICFCDEFTKG